MAYYAGIDLGATRVRAAVAAEDGSIVGSDRRGTPQGPDGTAVTGGVLDAVRAACERAGIEPGRLRVAGIGSVGPLDPAAGTVEDSPNLPDDVGEIELRDPVRRLIGSDRVHLHNDATAGVIGERFYTESDPDDMVYLTVSTGIGAGVAVDGHVLRGRDGNAGEVGHLVVDPRRRRRCGCGHRGHWEAYCSGNNLPGYARFVHEEEGIETGMDLGDPGFDAATVFAHAGEDPLADAAIDRVADWNAIGVANLVHAFAPLVVAVGGAVALNNERHVIDPIRERVPGMVMSGVPEIRPAELGEDAVLRGAIASALTGGTG